MGDISRVHVSQDNASSSDNSVGAAKPGHHLLDDMPLFLRAVAYSGLQNPLNAVAEVADQFGAKIEPHLQFVNAPEAGSSFLDKAQVTVGGALGMLVPYAIGGAASKKILGLGAGEEAVARLGTGAFSLSLKESALTGGLTGLLLTPAQPGHNFWESRAYNSLSGAATFSLMTASALKMKSFSETVPLFKSDAFVGAASGFAGGAVNTQMDSLIQSPEHKFATLGQTIEGAATMSVLGGAFGAMHDARAAYKNYYSSDGLSTAHISDDAGNQLPVIRATSAGNLDALADTTRGADARGGAETVGVKTVGAETVGAETVRAETVRAETVRAESTKIQSAPSPFPDLDIFKDEKVLAILRQTPGPQQMPDYIANYLQAGRGIPAATGPAQVMGDGSTVTPWRVGEIRKTSGGTTVVTNHETASTITYDEYGRVTGSTSVDKRGNQTARNFVYGEDGHLIAAVHSDTMSRVMNQNSGENGWFRGKDGWIEGVLYKGGADFDEPDPTRTLAVSKAGNFVSGKGGSAEVNSPEGGHFRINDYSEAARRRIEQLASDAKSPDLPDLYSKFKAATDERIKSADALAALNSLMQQGSADEIRNFLIKTNELFSQGSPDNITRVDIRGSRDGSTWATVTRYDATTNATIEASTDGVTITRKGSTTLRNNPDGSKTFKKPHPERELDESTAYYDADGRLNKIEFKASAQASSMRTYSRNAQGNVIGLAETNSNGSSTNLFQQGADWVVQLRGSDGKLSELNYKNAQVTAGDDGAISITSTTDNTGISFDPHGTREIRTQDGRVQSQRPNGRVDYTAADIAYERGTMQRGIEEAFPEERARRERFRTQAGDFEKAAAERGLSQGTIALTLAQVNRILTEPSAHWSARERANLAELVLSHATNPVEISQGDNGTCNVTTVEHRLYALEPDKIAAMIADVSRDGKYTQANGKVIDASEIANGLVPDPEARRNTNLQAHGYVEKSKDGTRDFASQIAQSLLIHTKWSEQTLYVSADKVVSDNVASMEDSTGNRNMVYFQPKNLAPESDADPNLVSLYSAGHYLGKIDPARVEKMLDQGGAWLSELKPGETAYDGKVQPLVTHTTAGDISFAPAPVDEQGRSTGTSRLTLNLDGKQIPLVDADSKVLDGPQLSYLLYTSMYDNITGTKTTEPFVFSAMGDDGTSSAEELGEKLRRLGEAKKLPAIVVVNVAQPLFGNAVPGWHVLNVYDYDPATQLVRYSNQWSRASDRMDTGVPLAQLFQAMKAPVVTPTDSASGRTATPPIVPPPRWLNWFRRQ